ADGLAGAGLTRDQAAAAASRVSDHMTAAILILYRSAVELGDEWGPALDGGLDRPSLALWGGDDIYARPGVADRMAARVGGGARGGPPRVGAGPAGGGGRRAPGAGARLTPAEPLVLPAPCLVVLVGPSSAGKTTWALEHFATEEVVSTDQLRAVVGRGTD